MNSQQNSQSSVNQSSSIQLDILKRQHESRMKELRYFLKWVKDNVSQIRADLEIITFRIFFCHFQRMQRRKDLVGKISSIISKDFQSIQSHFLSFELKKCITCLHDSLVGKTDELNHVVMKIQENYEQVFVSLYAYEITQTFISLSDFKISFCREVVLHYVKRLNPLEKQKKVNVFNEEYNLELSRDLETSRFNFLTNFQEINLFHQLDIFEPTHQSTPAFSNLKEQLACSIEDSVDEQPSLVYSVLQKSLMINDFIERKNLIGEHCHPNILQICLEDNSETITCVDISKGGNIVIFGTSDSQILLFDVGDMQMNNQNSQQQKRNKSNKKKIIQVIPDRIKKRNKFIGHEDAVTSISIVNNESLFVSSSVDLQIRLWDIKLNTCLYVYKGHLRTIWNVKFARQGFLFGSCSADRIAMLWTTNSSNPAKLLIGHQSDVKLMEFFENLQQVATASLDNSIKFWEIKSGLCLATLQINSPVISMNLSFSGQYLVSGQENGSVRLWNLQNWKLEKCFHFLMEGNAEEISSVNLSFDESTLVINTPKRLAYVEILPSLQDKEEIWHNSIIAQISSLNPLNDMKEVFEIPKNSSEQYLISCMHNRNFIIVISKRVTT